MSGLAFVFAKSRLTHLTLDKIAIILKSKTRGWINYFGKFRRSDMHGVLRKNCLDTEEFCPLVLNLVQQIG